MPPQTPNEPLSATSLTTTSTILEDVGPDVGVAVELDIGEVVGLDVGATVGLNVGETVGFDVENTLTLEGVAGA